MTPSLNTILDTVAPWLIDFGLLDDDTVDRAQSLATDASRYRALSRGSEGYVNNRIAEAVGKLSSDAKLNEDKIIATAATIPDPAVVTRIADEIERGKTREARSMILDRAGEVVPMVNARFDDLAAETADVAKALGHIDSAQQAIDAGVTDHWRRAGELQAEYLALRGLISELRELGQVAAPRTSQRGPWWMWLRDVDPNDFLPKGASKWALFVRDMRRGPWTPASIAEAEAVRVEWERAA